MKKILINNNPWQTRIAVLRDDKLQDIYFDTVARNELERCFFKGKILKILPGIQTVFVDIGHEKAGFLHITEVDRALAAERSLDAATLSLDEETIDRKIKKEMDVYKIFKDDEEILVQVNKEPVYGKGAKLTTCFTIPGRLIVLMPNVPQIGISKKIEDRQERQRLRSILNAKLPKGMGAVIRTTAEGKDEREIEKDLGFLISIWKSIQKDFKKSNVGERIFEDIPLVLRVVRDHLDKDVDLVLVDNAQDHKKIYNFVKNTTPEHAIKIRLYEGPPSIFAKYEIDEQLGAALQKKVSLKSGGSLILETTEAMTVIDVNTGRFTGKGNLEDTILKTNLEAAEEVVTQLRLRNIGGLIVIDFIDMASQSNRQKLSRHLEKMLRERDKFQTVALKVSEFGLVQMTRKRSGKTLIQALTSSCQGCNSYGFVKSTQFNSYSVLDLFKDSVLREGLRGNLVLITAPDVFDHLVHKEFNAILALEKIVKCKILLEANTDLRGDKFIIEKIEV